MFLRRQVNAPSTRFVKNAANPSSKLRFIGSLKTSVAGATAHIGVDVDTINMLDLTSAAVVYELVTGEFDISGLSTGRHAIDVTLKSEEVAESAYNDQIDILFIK